MTTTQLVDDAVTKGFNEISANDTAQAAINQARLEKEGQYKLWLEMPQTKELISTLETQINVVDEFMDRVAGTTPETALRAGLAQRNAYRQILNHIQKGNQ